MTTRRHDAQNETLPAHYSTVDDDKSDNDTQAQGYQTGAQGSTQTARDESDSNSVDYGYDNCKPEHYLLTSFFTSKLSMSLNNTFFPGKNGRLRAISQVQFTQDIADMPLDRMLRNG
jgi:hypothetical protein